MKRKLLLFYSKLYHYAIIMLFVESAAFLYSLSKGNWPNMDIAMTLWFILVMTGITSYICKTKLIDS